MSYLGIVVSSVFVSNALLAYGLEAYPGYRNGKAKGFAAAIALIVVDFLAAGMLWCLRIFVLQPFGLERLDLLGFVLLAVPLLKAYSSFVHEPGEGFFARTIGAADDLVVSSLVFGIALVAARGDFDLSEALLAGAASGLGYWLASTVLDSLRERLELSDLSPAFRGAPSMLISAGLMAMALMGIDVILVRNLVG